MGKSHSGQSSYSAGHTQQWSCKKNILTPLAPKDRSLYDTLAAVGECDGFKITNNRRVRAMLLRLLDPERPVARDVRDVFAKFLSNQLNKALKYAKEDGEPAYIRALRDVGAISEEDLPKFRKKLAAIKDPAFSQLAGELDAPAAPTAEESDSRHRSPAGQRHTGPGDELPEPSDRQR